MKSLRILLVFGPLVGIFGGCQCMPGTENLGNLVDATNDRAIHLDGLYRAEWDLTRIGHSDWCESKVNQFWCQRGCCKQNRPIVMGAEHQISGAETAWQNAVPIERSYDPPPLPAAEEY
ncbi:MAG TPA: hypothetical protein VMM56_05560 [Planctomycetaceae bacterium]|nr:hypothetical protein [Planctomycetaceae bacterium]